MKIFTRIVMDSATGAVEEADWFDYEGPLTLAGGGGSSKTTVKLPPKTATELAVDELTLAQLQRQEDQAQLLDPIIKQYIEDLAAEQAARDLSGLTPELRAQAELEDFERSRRMAAVEEELSTLQLEAIKRGGAATPEQIALINEATTAAQKTGEADIERFRTATLRQINEEVASASGLRPTDTPIVNLSERAGEEAARQQGILTSKLAETNAMARLNFPLASQKLTSDIAAGQQSLDLAAQQFQAQLRARAEDNRFRLFSGGSNAISPAGFGASLAQQRMGGATTSTNTSQAIGLGQIGQLAGGIGGLIGAFSDRRLKRDILLVGELLPGVNWYSFHYKWDEKNAPLRHGVMADELERVMPEAVLYDAMGYALVDYGALLTGRTVN